MLSKKLLSVLSMIIIVTLSCTLFSESPEDTPTPDPGPQETQAAMALQLATFEAKETLAAQEEQASDALSTSNAQSTIEAEEKAGAEQTEIAIAEETSRAQEDMAAATQAKQQTESAKIEEEQSATAEAQQQITAQAQTMVSWVEQLYEEGVVPSTEGTYVRLEDFDESMAQINWFQWWDTGYSPENFVIRTDLFYSSASDKVNWFNSGCGFVYGIVDDENFHVSQLKFDGFVTLLYWAGGDGNWIAKRPAGKLDLPEGEAEIMLVVSDKRVTFYVNGEEKLSEYAGRLQPGELAYTLGSGTNIGYGTRCNMTNVDLWIIE